MRSKKIRVYRTVETVTDRVEENAVYKKIIHYWVYTCPACRRTYKPSRNLEMPWAEALAHALEHPKHCPGDPFERLWKQVSAK